MNALSTRRPVLAFLALLTLATAAIAGGAALEPEADALLADYLALEADAETCPNGECAEAAEMGARFDALELRQADLLAARADLDPCSDCQTVDGLIDDIAASSELLRGGGLGEWEETD